MMETSVFWYVIFCALRKVVKSSDYFDLVGLPIMEHLGMHNSMWDHCVNHCNLVSRGCMLFMLSVSMAKSLA